MGNGLLGLLEILGLLGMTRANLFQAQSAASLTTVKGKPYSLDTIGTSHLSLTMRRMVIQNRQGRSAEERQVQCELSDAALVLNQASPQTGFKKRYFILTAACLQYFKKPTDKKPRGTTFSFDFIAYRMRACAPPPTPSSISAYRGNSPVGAV